MMRTALTAATLLAFAMTAHADDTQLTIYSGDFDAVSASLPGPGIAGFALVQQTRRFTLQSGANVLTLDRLPPAIDANGVRLAARRDGIDVLSQRFDFAIADQGELLRRALGRRVTVQQIQGSAVQTHTGTLLAAGDGLTLALDDGRVRVLRDYAGFELEALPDGVRASPTLRWDVRSRNAGDSEFSLDYPTAGLAWRAEYRAVLRGAGNACRMQFSGAAQVLNRSGASFDAAQLTLVAGEPNVQRSAAPQPMMMMAKARTEFADAAAPSPQASGEYHAYRIPGRSDVPDGSVQRIPLLSDAAGVACVRRYESRSPMGYFRPSSPVIHADFGPVGTQPVNAMLEFTNRPQDGLGMPLPAGRLRVYVAGEGGNDDFLGDAQLDHTAAGREVKAALGEVFDLSLERTRESLALDPDRLGLSEAIVLELGNAKKEAATVRVLESLPRWTDWDVVDSSAKWTRVDAQTIAFDVAVPAAGEATVRYRVRYRWPESVKP